MIGCTIGLVIAICMTKEAVLDVRDAKYMTALHKAGIWFAIFCTYTAFDWWLFQNAAARKGYNVFWLDVSAAVIGILIGAVYAIHCNRVWRRSHKH